MEHLKLIAIFNAVLKHGSMNAAAQHLNMTASAVSQHIQKLEKHYQIKLLNRTTRSLAPTEEGRILWQYAQQLADLSAQTEQAMQNLRAEPAGDVRITLPEGYAQTPAIRQTIASLREHYPAIRLILIEDNRLSDLHADHSPDIAIRAVPEPDDDRLIARPLAHWPTMICASPDYLSRHPIAATQDLPQAHWLNFQDSVLLDTLQQLGLSKVLPPSRTDCLNHSSTARELARAGLGLAVLLAGDVAPYIADGSLVQVLPQYPLPVRTIYAVTAYRGQSAKIRVVLETLSQCFAAQ